MCVLSQGCSIQHKHFLSQTTLIFTRLKDGSLTMLHLPAKLVQTCLRSCKDPWRRHSPCESPVLLNCTNRCQEAYSSTQKMHALPLPATECHPGCPAQCTLGGIAPFPYRVQVSSCLMTIQTSSHIPNIRRQQW